MINNIEGKKIPNVTFPIMQDGSWSSITSDQLFKNKKVIVFSLPGAFTPTCSSSHVPRYNELYNVFAENGVDDIICISVNDTFVMNAWKKDQKAENLYFLPDGNGTFTEKMGMLVDKIDLGFGRRSWRYAMIVNNGTIEKMFIEPEVEGDPFEVSDADTLLKYINPSAKLPKEVTIITKPGCPHCMNAKKILNNNNMSYEEIVLGGSNTMTTLRAITSKSTVPQVYIDGKLIGGYDELSSVLN
jgi:glutathione-dependent peroxiredoxin